MFAGIERMRFGRNFNLHERVCFTFEFHGFARFDGRASDEFEVVRYVVEQYFDVIWMNALFHDIAFKSVGSQSSLRRSLLLLDPIVDHLPVVEQ
jgi:hypothetical protein